MLEAMLAGAFTAVMGGSIMVVLLADIETRGGEHNDRR